MHLCNETINDKHYTMQNVDGMSSIDESINFALYHSHSWIKLLRNVSLYKKKSDIDISKK